MRRRVLLLASSLLIVAASIGFATLKLVQTGVDMTAAATAFVKTLNDDQRAKTVLAYDAPVRTDWHFIPKPERKGLQVKEMSEPQRAAAHDLLRAALSATGYSKATKIMALESVLRELEKSRANSPLRDPERYFFTLFGEPSADGRWGLSVEGHHLSLNFVVDANKVASSTPTFYGANPGVLQADYGPEFKKGLRVLAQEEELAYALLGSLSPEQRKSAVLADKAPGDVRDAGKAYPPQGTVGGLAGRDMNDRQRAILRALVEEYAHNLPPDVAGARLAAIAKEGYEGVTFAWSGPDTPSVGHDYKIQGPTFLIEFNNTQPDSAGNLANHIHSVWHDAAGNFNIPVK